MKELIYKDDVRRAILKANPSVAFCIDGIKSVDAVEVVRCKDCVDWRNLNKVTFDGEPADVGDCNQLSIPTGAYFFCQYGERREV